MGNPQPITSSLWSDCQTALLKNIKSQGGLKAVAKKYNEFIQKL